MARRPGSPVGQEQGRFFTAEAAEDAEELQLQMLVKKLLQLTFLCVLCDLCGKKELLPRA